MAKKKRRAKNEIKRRIETAGGGIVIPVNKAIKSELKILNFWHVERLLKKADRIAAQVFWVWSMHW